MKLQLMTPLWRCHHQGLLQTLATPSLPVKSQAVVLWPGLTRQPTDDAWSRAVGSGTCTPWEVGSVGCDRGSSGIEGGQEEHGEGGGGTYKGRRGRAKASCRDQELATSKQVLRPAWLMCAKTLPLAGLWVPT
jgi:hypothetical protein